MKSNCWLTNCSIFNLDSRNKLNFYCNTISDLNNDLLLAFYVLFQWQSMFQCHVSISELVHPPSLSCICCISSDFVATLRWQLPWSSSLTNSCLSFGVKFILVFSLWYFLSNTLQVFLQFNGNRWWCWWWVIKWWGF